MRHSYGVVILLLSNLWASGQVTGIPTPPPVFFSVAPHNLQLFARDSTNQATVSVAGFVTQKGYQALRLFWFRENKLLTVSTRVIDSSKDLNAFYADARIRAERAQYGLKVFLYRSATDSALVLERQRLVCGDVLVFHGQSNASGGSNLSLFGDRVDDTYLRNCTFPYDATDIPNQLSWYPAELPFASVGVLGLWLQKLILDKYGIPTALFNGAVGGASLVDLTQRMTFDAANTGTLYGRLLTRLRWAGLDRQVRAVIWRQGENEAGDLNHQNAAAYPTNFARFYQNLRQDLGTKFRLYVGQINLLATGNSASAALREFQRQTPARFARTAAMSTVGAVGYDGLHYSDLGYIQQAEELFRQLDRDLYGGRDTLQIDAPSVQKIFRNARHDTLTLVFQPDQHIRWPADSVITNPQTGFRYQRRLRDFFFMDDQITAVRGGSAAANRVTLALTAPGSATSLTYLPPWFSDAQSSFYNGPLLTNGRELRAFSFNQVPIADQLPAPTLLTVTEVSSAEVRLRWTLPPTSNRDSIRLERAVGNGGFSVRATLPPTATSYVDNVPASRQEPYRYRVVAVGRLAESAPSNIAVVRPVVLDVTRPVSASLRVYPNPVASGGRLAVTLSAGLVIGQLRLFDTQGRLVHSRPGADPVWQLPALPTGRYVAEITPTDREPLRLPLLIE